MLGRHNPDTLRAVTEVSVRIGGTPSCVMSAVLELTFDDGRREEFEVNFAPDGMTFDTWRLHLDALKNHIARRH